MKKCVQCNIQKDICEFNKDSKKKDGLKNICRLCHKENNYEYKKTKKGVLTNIYSQQKSSSIKRGHPSPSYSKEELGDWLFARKNFQNIYNEWINSNYDKDLTPSIDRINNDLPYTFGNIQLMTWKENNERFNTDMRNGIETHKINPQKPIIGINLKTKEKIKFLSIMEAERKTKIGHGNIIRNCKGERKSAGGYNWNYVNL